MLTVGSLFAGIGGIELGLEWTGGFQTVWQVENNEYARRVLEKHWPNVRRWDDVRTFPPEPVDEWRCDLICGGFPCQDISYAGKGAGLVGERSGLWWEFARIIRSLGPRYVLVENVAALLRRGLDAILGTLASFGYDAEWHCLPAAAFGLPTVRSRVYVLAYSAVDGREGPICGNFTDLAEACAERIGRAKLSSPLDTRRAIVEELEERMGEPAVFRTTTGVPARLVKDRLGCLGNAVVPQVAQWIGERILECDP